MDRQSVALTPLSGRHVGGVGLGCWVLRCIAEDIHLRRSVEPGRRDPALSHCGICRVQLAHYRFASFLHGDHSRSAGTAERVKHDAAAWRAGQDARSDQVRREGREVRTLETLRRHRPHTALVTSAQGPGTFLSIWPVCSQ